MLGVVTTPPNGIEVCMYTVVPLLLLLRPGVPQEEEEGRSKEEGE